MRRILLVALLASGAAAGTEVRAEPESLQVQVNRAVDRGVARLRAWQNPDGSFQGPGAAEYPAGETALALYAMAKSQVPGEDPAMAKGIAFVKARPVVKTYEAAAGILALDALKDPAHDAWIRVAARWLEEHVNPKEGVWSYPFGPNADFYKTDLSNTQFAVLGLWAAERHGTPARKELWEGLVRALPPYQAACGGFFYSTNRGDRQASGSMTTAGVTVLTLALDRMSADERAKQYAGRAAKALERGWEYLDRRFTVTSDLDGAYAFRQNGYFYFLYGMERVAALADRKKIGGRDWYAEGARQLVSIQDADGAWRGNSEETSFALLFLRKATSTTMGREDVPVTGPAEPKPAPPTAKRPGNDVPFVTRWLVLGPLPNADDSALESVAAWEANAAPTAGQRVEAGTWNAFRTGRSFVDFREATGAKDHTVSYAFTWVHARRETDVVLWFDTDNGASLLLDGRRIHERHFHEGAEPDRRSVAVHLGPGAHRLLFKVEEWSGGTGIYFRMAHPDGTDAREVVPTLSPATPDEAEEFRLRADSASFADLYRTLPVDANPTLSFSRPEDLDRVVVSHAASGYPRWLRRSEGKPNNPHPGALGILAVHPRAQNEPALVVRKVRLPAGSPLARLVVSADPYETPEIAADFDLIVSVFDGALHDLTTARIVGGPPSPDGWRTIDVDLKPYAGKDVLLIAEFAAGGVVPWHNEEGFLDELSVGTASR